MPVCVNGNRSSHNLKTVGFGRKSVVDYQTGAFPCSISG